MAALPRSAKLGGDWTYSDIRAFNIQFSHVDAQTFFGNDQLPDAAASQAILDNTQHPLNLPDIIDRRFFQHLEWASESPPEEGSIIDFITVIFEMLGYNNGCRIWRTCKKLRFKMCGQRVSTEADICVLDVSSSCDKFLLVQENKCHLKPGEPEPQLIAHAVAAFYENNRARRRARLPPLETQVIPGIIMVGTSPTFYKIPVTQDLLDCIAEGRYPSATTTVERLIIPFLSKESLDRDGMGPLDNRQICFQCFQAFKQFLD